MVSGFNKVTDKFVDKFFTKEGEPVEEAKKRMAEKQSELDADRKERMDKLAADQEKRLAAQQEMINKSLETSKNAGKLN